MAIPELITRRQFFIASSSFLAGSSMVGLAAFDRGTATKPNQQTLYFSACTDANNQHHIVGFSKQGEMDFLLPINERAHDSLYNGLQQQVLFFGRSPSTTIYIVDLRQRQIVQRLEAEAGRHFYGHGVFNQAGYLFATQHDIAKQRGSIAVYDPRQAYKKVTEFSSHGVEPHQLSILPDGQTLVVANGGLFKDPDNSKNILNKGAIESSLSYINSDNGELLAQFTIASGNTSLRHLVVDYDSRVYIGAQTYGEDFEPLIYSHNLLANKHKQVLQPLEAEMFIWQMHNHYTASLAINGNILAVTSPRGNVVSFWDTRSGRYLSQKRADDIAGIALSSSMLTDTMASFEQSLFIASSGMGAITALPQKHTIRLQPLSWDHHMSRM